MSETSLSSGARGGRPRRFAKYATPVASLVVASLILNGSPAVGGNSFFSLPTAQAQAQGEKPVYWPSKIVVTDPAALTEAEKAKIEKIFGLRNSDTIPGRGLNPYTITWTNDKMVVSYNNGANTAERNITDIVVKRTTGQPNNPLRVEKDSDRDGRKYVFEKIKLTEQQYKDGVNRVRKNGGTTGSFKGGAPYAKVSEAAQKFIELNKGTNEHLKFFQQQGAGETGTYWTDDRPHQIYQRGEGQPISLMVHSVKSGITFRDQDATSHSLRTVMTQS